MSLAGVYGTLASNRVRAPLRTRLGNNYELVFPPCSVPPQHHRLVPLPGARGPEHALLFSLSSLRVLNSSYLRFLLVFYNTILRHCLFFRRSIHSRGCSRLTKLLERLLTPMTTASTKSAQTRLDPVSRPQNPIRRISDFPAS